MKLTKTLPVLAVSAIALAACTNPDGSQNRTGTGAAVGTAAGAALGNLIGGDTEATIIGGVIGGALGTGVGYQLDQQAAELEQSIGGSGATIVNTGDRLIVSMPEAITFAVDSADLRPSIRDEIVAVSQSLQNYPNTSVQVIGHTDNTGSASYNQGLSERRAQSVTNVLVASGTPANRIFSSGRGMTQPVATNDTEAGRAANRRVEIIITPNA
ncbi:OmpA family protein [Amaricoccus tamworthensis]|uniref:OmpA family protein n=1 Tax=Amaricoccus tamworthensis TaxID=57002 RepID=UPI003C7B3691